MKRKLIWLLILAFLIPSLAYMAEENIEKIPSPTEIKNFKVVKNLNGILYGIRMKEKKLEKMEAKLERIPSPAEMKNFGQIKKVGNALWGVRLIKEANLGTATLTPAIIGCLKTTIDRKDGATKAIIVSGKDGAVKAIDARNTCQKASLDLATNPEKVKAFKVCKDSYNKTLKDLRDAAQKAKIEIWQTYKEEVKSCYGTAASSTVNNILTEGQTDEIVL